MDVTLATAKEIFISLGATLGFLAFLRPVIETKHKKDQELLADLIASFNEQHMLELEAYIYDQRRVDMEVFVPIDSLIYRRAEKHSSLRFIGPYGKHYLHAIDRLIANYKILRTFVQVPEWVPFQVREDAPFFWKFDKSAFFSPNDLPYSKDYADHLRDASVAAEQVKLAYQQLQQTQDLHLYEWPVAGLLLKRRARNLKPS